MQTLNKQEFLSFIFSGKTAKELQENTSPKCFDPSTFADYCQEKLDSLPQTEHTIRAHALLTEACRQFREMAEQAKGMAEQAEEKTDNTRVGEPENADIQQTANVKLYFVSEKGKRPIGNCKPGC